MKHTRKIAALLGAGLMITLAACGGSNAGPASDADVDTSNGLVINGETIADAALYDVAKEQTLTVYSSYQETAERAIIENFTADTGIRAELVRLVPTRLAERVLSEKGSNSLAADIVRISDYHLVNSLSDAGVFTPYIVPGTEDLEEVVVNDGEFSRVQGTVMTVGYNSALVSAEDAPKSWKDLLDPKWNGQLGITPGTSGGAMAAMNRFVVTELGEDYYQQYADNGAVVYDGVGSEQAALARGEIMVGTVSTPPVSVAVESENAPLEYIIPEEGIVVFDYYIGATGSGQASEAAQVFMNYNFSKRGQEYLVELGDYSVRTDVATPNVLGRDLPAIDSDQFWRMSLDEVDNAQADAAVWTKAFQQ